MEENKNIKKESMISDIRDNNLTGMISSKGKERWAIISTVYGVLALGFLIFIFPILTSILNINNFIAKSFIYLIIVGVGYYLTIEEFVYQRRKKDKKKMEMISKGGDMVSYFMKIKDFVRKDYDIPYRVTVIEGLNYQTVPLELTYHEYEEYAKFVDTLSRNNVTFQEYELRGRITLFDKYRTLYNKFEGTTLIKFCESIFRENERRYKYSTSRRLYILLNIPYSKNLEEILASTITSSSCKMQFLTEKMFKEMTEFYFCCPVNLERMKAHNVIKKISIEDTKLIAKFNNEDDLLKFLETYKSTKYKNTFKFKVRR